MTCLPVGFSALPRDRGPDDREPKVCVSGGWRAWTRFESRKKPEGRKKPKEAANPTRPLHAVLERRAGAGKTMGCLTRLGSGRPSLARHHHLTAPSLANPHRKTSENSKGSEKPLRSNGQVHLRPRLRDVRVPRTRAAGPSGGSSVRQWPRTPPRPTRALPMTANRAAWPLP